MKICLSKSNERRKGQYHYCKKCGTKTFLVIIEDSWRADCEPYKSGESMEEVQDPREKSAAEKHEDFFEAGTEISGHYCPCCKQLTSICINTELAGEKP